MSHYMFSVKHVEMVTKITMVRIVCVLLIHRKNKALFDVNNTREVCKSTQSENLLIRTST